MSDVAVLMPAGGADPARARARTFVEDWYARELPRAELHAGDSGEPWSKGAAIADALARTTASTLVLADADSFLLDPEDLRRAVALVSAGELEYVFPHRKVYRLNEKETARLHENPRDRPRLGWLVRPVYEGPEGGGITIVSRTAYETVGGIDARFLGWGGEDLALGWALRTLVPGGHRADGRLVHLWHPHPAPTMRGTPESEELVARYREARGIERRMAAVVAGESWEPAQPLAEPIRFRLMANRTVLRLPSGESIKFRAGIHETTDTDIAEQLRGFRIVKEERRR